MFPDLTHIYDVKINERLQLFFLKKKSNVQNSTLKNQIYLSKDIFEFVMTLNKLEMNLLASDFILKAINHNLDRKHNVMRSCRTQ